MDDKQLSNFFERVDVDAATGCWIWTGNFTSDGVPRFYIGRAYGVGLTRLSTITIWEHFVGRMDSLTHSVVQTCGNDICVNPLHLKKVTRSERYKMVPTTTTAKNAAKTHCPRGHPLSGDNLVVDRRGSRSCKQCKRLHDAARMNRKRQKAKQDRERERNAS